MKEKDILTMNVKKIVPWGNGLAIYVTKEAKELGWNDKTKIVLYTLEDEKGKAILIRKAPKTT